jgi:glycogen synthase
MRILLMSASYAPVLGGLQTVTAALAGALTRRRHEVRVVTGRYPRTLPARDEIDGVPVERRLFLRPRLAQLRGGRADLFVASLYHTPAVRLGLARLMRTFRPDVVNVHFPDAQIPFVLSLRRRFRFRLVVSLHGHDVERFSPEDARRDVSRDLRGLLLEADAVTACSRHLLRAACNLEPSVGPKGMTIYNGIDPDRFRDGDSCRHSRPYVLALGRLTWKKGFDLLLEALARLGPRGPDLLLAGQGEQQSELESLARRLGLSGRVHFLGTVSQAEVVRLLNGSLFLAVPSRAEPFGIVALEALAAGKPVLATRVGGMAEFLSDLPSDGGMVCLVPADIDGLEQGLLDRLAFAASGRDGVATGVRIREDYSWARAIQRYESVLAG